MPEPTTSMGYLSRVKINGAFFGVRNWSVDRSADAHEVGTTEDGRYKSTKGGRWEARVSLQVFEDSEIDIYAVPLELYEGAMISLYIYPNGIDEDPYYFPDFLVTQVGHKGDVSAPNDLNFSGVSVGSYTVPGMS